MRGPSVHFGYTGTGAVCVCVCVLSCVCFFVFCVCRWKMGQLGASVHGVPKVVRLQRVVVCDAEKTQMVHTHLFQHVHLHSFRVRAISFS